MSNKLDLNQNLPVLPLRPGTGLFLFWGTVLSLFVGRPASQAAIRHARGKSPLLLVMQKSDNDVRTPSDLCDICFAGTLILAQELPDGVLKVLVELGERARLTLGTVVRDENEVLWARSEVFALELGDEAAVRSSVERIARQAVEFSDRLLGDDATSMQDVVDSWVSTKNSSLLEIASALPGRVLPIFYKALPPDRSPVTESRVQQMAAGARADEMLLRLEQAISDTVNEYARYCAEP